MKQVASVIADDGDFKITIRADLYNKYGREFSRDEQKSIKRALQRNLAAAIRGLPYTDFGIENTRVK